MTGTDFADFIATHRRLILLGLLLLIVIGGAGYRAWRGLNSLARREAVQLMDSGAQALSEKRYSDALSFYQRAQELMPDEPEVYQKQAEIYLTKNRVKEAEEVLQEGLRNSRDKAELYSALGRAAVQAEDYAAAIDYFLQADQKEVEIQLDLADAYLHLGQKENAGKALDKLSELDAQNGWGFFYRAAALADGAIPEALASAESASASARSAPSSSADSTLSSYAQHLTQDLTAAAAAENPGYQNVLVGYALLQADFPALALSPLRKAVEAKPDYRDGWALRGAAELELKEYAAATASLGKALALDPDYAYARYLQGQLHRQEGKNELAKAELAAAVEFAPAQLSYYDAYLDLLLELEDYPAAASVLELIIGNENFAAQKQTFEIQLAFLELDHLGQLQDGLQLARQYKDSEVYAWALHKNEQSTEALTILQALIDKEPTAWLYYRLGQVQSALGMDQEAQASLDRALDLDTAGEILSS